MSRADAQITEPVTAEESENAKLRKLVSDMWAWHKEVSPASSCFNLSCDHPSACKGQMLDCPERIALCESMAELGIQP